MSRSVSKLGELAGGLGSLLEDRLGGEQLHCASLALYILLLVLLSLFVLPLLSS